MKWLGRTRERPLATADGTRSRVVQAQAGVPRMRKEGSIVHSHRIDEA